MKTPEEILAESYDNHNDLKVAVREAMKVYAKQTAIEFTEWCSDNHWERSCMKGEMVNKSTMTYKPTDEIFESWWKKQI